jgi:hypothetical protein
LSPDTTLGIILTIDAQMADTIHGNRSNPK